MKILKSKKTGLEHSVTEEEYAAMVREGTIINRFDVTDIRMRPSVSQEVPIELKAIIKKTKQ